MMTPENFTYWLQGFFEITGTKEVTPEQVEMIKAHLGYVFAKPATIVPPSTTTGALEQLRRAYERQSPWDQSIQQLPGTQPLVVTC